MIDVVLEPRANFGSRISRGQIFRIQDLDGTQTADIVFFNAENFKDKYSPAYTVNINKNAYLVNGGTLYSTMCNPMLTIVSDSVRHHDLICGMCSPGVNRVKFGDRASGVWTCQENLMEALSPWEVAVEDLPGTFNVFMDYPAGPDGEITYKPNASKPGDHVDLRADMDVVVGLSNCPQDLSNVNGFNPSRLRIVIADPNEYDELIAASERGDDWRTLMESPGPTQSGSGST